MGRLDEQRGQEPRRRERPPGLVCAALVAAALGACAGRAATRKHPSAAEYCASERQAFAERLTRERDEVPRVPDAAEVARWHRFESTHFALSTDLDARLGEHTLRELEDYFAALTSIAFPVTPPAVKIPVIALASPEETQRYLRPCDIGSYDFDLIYQPLLVLGPGAHGIDDAIARHELVHYVMRIAYRRSLPRWFAEGMATYFETLAYDAANGQLMFGRATLSRVHDLREKGPLLPVEKLVDGSFDSAMEDDARKDETRASFYASAWLLTHALVNDAVPVFTRLDKELLAGASGGEAWTRATSPQFRAGADVWITGYYQQRRYEAGRRTRWRPPEETFTSMPMTAADTLTTLALLHTVGNAAQSERADWHRAHALAAARGALERDPTQLDALQVEWKMGSPPSVDRVRPALHGREQSWVAWIVLARALAHERTHDPGGVQDTERHDAEQREALARAAALNPGDPKVLLARAGDALEFGHWDEASRLYEAGLPFVADEPRFAYGYVAAMTHDARCGSVARDLNEHIKTTDQRRAWIDAARTLADCRVHGAAGASTETNP